MNDRERHDSTDGEERRSFLRRSGAAMLGLGLGAGGLGRARGQSGGGRDGNGESGGLPDVRMVLPNDGPLARDFFRDVVLFTEPTEVKLNADDLSGCGDFLPSPPFEGYQGLVVDRAEIEQLFESGDLSELGPLSETDVFVSEGVDVRIGSPYVITDGNYCEGDYIAATAHELRQELEGGTDSGDGGFVF